MKVVVFKIAQHFAIIGNWTSFSRKFVNKKFKIAQSGHTGCDSVSKVVASETSGQSYKASMIVNYDSRVVPYLKIPHITTLES